MLCEIFKALRDLVRPAVQTDVMHGVHAVDDSSKLFFVDHRGAKRQHQLVGIDSLKAYADRETDPKAAAAYVDASGVRLVLAEEECDHSIVTMGLVASTALTAWTSVAGRPMKPADIRAFFDDRADDIADGAVLAAVSDFKANSSYEYTSENEDEVTIAIKSGATTNGAKMPKSFDITIALWLGLPIKRTISVGLDVKVNKDSPPEFTLRLRNLPDVVEDALVELTREVQLHLPDHLVVRGTPKAGPAAVVTPVPSHK